MEIILEENSSQKEEENMEVITVKDSDTKHIHDVKGIENITDHE